MIRIMSMNQLLEESVRVYPWMIMVNPLLGEEEELNVSDLIPKYNNCYAVNNSTICFIVNNQIFAIPYSVVITTLLENEGISRKEFYVPFSNGTYPKGERNKWNKLRREANITYFL